MFCTQYITHAPKVTYTRRGTMSDMRLRISLCFFLSLSFWHHRVTDINLFYRVIYKQQKAREVMEITAEMVVSLHTAKVPKQHLDI